MSLLTKIKDRVYASRAEDFPKKIVFTKREYLSILFIPLIFLNSYIFSWILSDKESLAVADALFRGLLFILIVILYFPLLKLHWSKFKQGKWFSYMLVILGAIVLQIVISITQSLLPASENSSSVDKSTELVVNGTVFLISFTPLFTALIEDFVFRYTLLHKLFVPNKVWRLTLILLNSILFGLVHYNNFEGNILATTTFMSAGLFLNLIYIWTRNIWHVLLIHTLNNFVLSTVGLLVFWLLKSL